MRKRYLQMLHIVKKYPGVKALDNVSIEANEGEAIALLGENGAGKSTLMNVLGGVTKKDEGHIIINGKEVNIRNVGDAQKAGIAFIHQELSLFKELSVQENLLIDNLPVRKRLPFVIDKKEIKTRAINVFKILDMDIPITEKVDNLSMSQQQIVEIAGALLKNARIIILDEPSTSLTSHEREKVHEVINKLCNEGKIIIYISHDIEAALDVCHRVYVLRDGENSGMANSAEVTKQDIIKMMIGDKSGKKFNKTYRKVLNEKVVELKNISNSKLRDVSITLKKGEVLGLYGLIGSGRTELIRAIYGLDGISSGEILIKGQRIEHPSPKIMKKLGVGYLTENRRDEGLFLEMGIDYNTTITDLKKISTGKLGFVNKKKEYAITSAMIEKINIATPSEKQLSGKLSGGNQQKVVIAKWIHLELDVFILDEPTRGIDVGAKGEIYSFIDDIVGNGVSVILISSEIDEIMGLSDRIIVLSNGSVTAELNGRDVKQKEIIQSAMGC